MENTVPETQAAPQKKPKLGLILGIAIPVVIIAIVVGVFAGIQANKNNQYKKAIAYVDDGDIEEAVAIHEELGDYKDLTVQISDGAVDEFDNLLEKGSYKKVLRLYSAVANYPDALEEMDEMLKEHVADLMAGYNYSTAVDLYERAVKEETAVELVAQGMVDGTAAWLEENEFYDVIDVYFLLAENENAVKSLEEKISQRFVDLLNADDYHADSLYYALEDSGIHIDAVYAAIYDRACTLMENGEYYDAQSIFELLGEYQDSVQKIEEIELALAMEDMNYYLEQGWYSSALNVVNRYEGDVYDQLLALCNAAIYEGACTLMENEEYDDALDAFELLGDYEDAQEKVQQAQIAIASADIEYYMAQGWSSSAMNVVNRYEGEVYDQLLALYISFCGDGTVIADLEAAVAARMELEKQETIDYQAILDAELVYLEKYKNMPFYDSTLGDLVDDYLDALSDQQYYLNWYSADWYMPYYWGKLDATRYEALTALGESYGYAAENADLQAVLGTSETVTAYWEAWYSIYNDLRYDLNYQTDDAHHLIYTNDTGYTFSLRLHVSYTDSEDTELSSEDADYTAIAQEGSFDFIMTVPEGASYWTATWEIYDIYEGENFLG